MPSVQTSLSHLGSQPEANCLLQGRGHTWRRAPGSFPFGYSGAQAGHCGIHRFVPLSHRLTGGGRSLLTLSRWILLDHDLFVFAMNVAHVAIAIKRWISGDSGYPGRRSAGRPGPSRARRAHASRPPRARRYPPHTPHAAPTRSSLPPRAPGRRTSPNPTPAVPHRDHDSAVVPARMSRRCCPRTRRGIPDSAGGMAGWWMAGGEGGRGLAQRGG
jgi:hypothetical protein